MKNRLIILIAACAIRTNNTKNQQIEDMIMEEVDFLQETTPDCENQTGGSIEKLESRRTKKTMKVTKNRIKAYKEEIIKLKKQLAKDGMMLARIKQRLEYLNKD